MNDIFKIKLRDIQRFLMINIDSKDDCLLKDKLKSMVASKSVEKAKNILEYLKAHLDDDLKTSDNSGRRYGIYEHGSYFHMMMDDAINDILDDLEEQNNGAITDSKVQHKKQTFRDCLLVQDKDGLLERLHKYLDVDGRKGKDAAMVVKVCCDNGLMQKPDTSVIIKEFNVGSRQGFDSQWKIREHFEKNRLSVIENILKDFI